MNRKTLLILSAAALSAVVLLALLLRPAFLFGPAERQPVQLAVVWEDAESLTALAKEFREFENLFPRWRVAVDSHKPLSLLEGLSAQTMEPRPELFMLPAANALDPALLESPPPAWTGTSWSLWYNKKALAAVGLDPSKLPPGALRLLPELASPSAFSATLAKLKAKGITPIALGSRYGWPQALWLQHLSAFLLGPAEAAALGAAAQPADDAGWRAAQELWQSWDKAGYLSKSWRTNDWPQAVIDFAEGKAAFCLLNQELLGTIPARQRGAIGELNFPIGEHEPWVIGSMWYLAMGKDAGQGAADLHRFLTSPGVTQRLSLALGRSFYSGESGMLMVPSVTGDSDSAFIKSLSQNQP